MDKEDVVCVCVRGCGCVGVCIFEIATYVYICEILIHTHTYNGILLSHKKNEVLPFRATWIGLEIIMLSEVC